jgi:cobalt-zinc-cadmium efflux system membrane fusion protein
MPTKTNIFLIAALILMAFALWFVESGHDHDHHHEDHHHAHHHDHDHEPQEVVAFNEEQLQTNGIDIQRARQGTLQRMVRAPAKIAIREDRMAHIFPKVTGNALEARKNLGEFVRQGELLAVLESREIAEAKAAYLATMKKEQLKAYCFEHERNLCDKGISAEQDFFHAKHEWEEAGIELELNRQKLHALGLSAYEIQELPEADSERLRFYELRAPISGRIIHRHFTPGELIGPDHEVFIVADLGTVWAEINVFPEDLTYLREGQVLTISIPEGPSTSARVVYLSPIIDEETRTAKAIAEIDNSSGCWYPGTFTCACLATHFVEYPLVIPKEAVQKVDEMDVIFVETSEGFCARPIKMGHSDEQNCEVVYGLEPGERYAAKNTFLLKADLKKEEAEHEH